MSDYTPKPGEEVLLTVRAVAGAYSEGNFGYKVLSGDGENNSTWFAIWGSNPRIVKVEPVPPPPLPTEFGSMILAKFSGSVAPSLLELGTSNGSPAWFYADAVSGGPVSTGSILPNWVQIDPTTMRPIEAAS